MRSSSSLNIHLLISLGRHGQVEPVENIMDLLALHLGLDAVGEETVAGLQTRETVSHNVQNKTESESEVCCISPHF